MLEALLLVQEFPPRVMHPQVVVLFIPKCTGVSSWLFLIKEGKSEKISYADVQYIIQEIGLSPATRPHWPVSIGLQGLQRWINHSMARKRRERVVSFVSSS
ncbi:uncharacterized protein OCT59_003654 [Rhizophagus irregularis]|uniref:uncharacterized protein n=1 Tax=Rhizophagus irregularis TaxID=588596 RepID=UPI000CBBBE17|nr:hypothetical protein OCT59_003654 [Rhizophagus irregularis]GBC17658.1 hypothetical protein RIR_jg28530.t1 [Rhizophagus irregularis DAOM 181602=DAOM 197198]